MNELPKQIGRYEVLQPLGSGGMATLFLAKDPAIGRLVAIKLLREFDNEELRERFAREARSAGQLRHINIVTIFDVGEHEGRPFIAMEYVEGETFSQLIKRQAPLATARKLQMMDELSAGLVYAHRAGIVHRDIKPTNVMLDGEGVVKILDFGIARISGDAGDFNTQTGVMIGTLNYMAPEQMMGNPVDARADVFSAGAVFYELLTGQQAFPGGLDTGILHKVIQQPAPPMLLMDPTLDPALVAMIGKCLEKSPDERYGDMSIFRRELAAVRSRLDRETDFAGDALSILKETYSPPSDRPSRAAPPPPPPPEMVAPSSPDFGATIITPPPPRVVQGPPSSPDVSDATLVFAPAQRPDTAGEFPDVQIVVSRSPDAHLIGRTLRISKPVFTMGRGDDCDLSLADAGWSREHAEIVYVDSGFVLRDSGSRNGTYLNGRTIKEAPLLFGAVITLGQTELIFSHVRDAPLPDLTGCAVADRYTLVRMLRKSGTGALYAATHDATGGQVAIKLLMPHLLRFAGYRDTFERKAQIAARLHHPHICGVIDYGATTLRPAGGSSLETQFVCFELMPGGTLGERLDAAVATPLAQVADWLASIASALDYAHRHDVFHGDLKPSAIVFDEDDHAYLTDFSIAQHALTAEGGPTAGTPAYMAPELWDESAITPAAEQFALAAITYYVVTGSKPFEVQENPSARRQNFRRGPIPAHEEAAHNGRPGAPRAVSQVLARALARDATQRFASPTAFASAFKAALRHAVQREAPEVFISYQREVSAPLAMYLADRLKGQGIHPFIDTQGLDRAGRFPPQIESAIEDSDVFICLLAATTLESAYVVEEIRAAHRYDKPMIPVMQESYSGAKGESADPAVAALLAHQGLPVLDRRNLHLEHTADNLVKLVKSALAQRGE
jgi:serine/threonine protein kinase